MGNDEIFTPWYADGMVDYNLKEHRRSFIKKEVKPATPTPYASTPVAPKPAERQPVVTKRAIVDRKRPCFGWAISTFPKMESAEVVATTRLALRQERDFILSSAEATDMLKPWFKESQQRGLADVALVLKYQPGMAAVLAEKEEVAILCWYRSGNVSKLTIGLAENNLFYTEKPLSVAGLQKPVCKDNLHDFREALLDIAFVAREVGWDRYFMKGVDILDSTRCTYAEKQQGFYLPEPFYKYLLAVRETQTGGGMGSWYDTPISDSTAFRIVTHQLGFEKCQAVLYAVNNC